MEGGNPTREALDQGANSGDKGEGGGEMVVVQGEGEEEEVLKREISCHPMFGLLKETHLNCLKICSGDQEEVPGIVLGQVQTSNVQPENSRTDLDLFMEEYCTALAELTQAMQKPMQEATAFIDFMYCVLDGIASADASSGATGTPEQEVGVVCVTAAGVGHSRRRRPD